MRLPTRTRRSDTLPGLQGRARVAGRRDVGSLRGLRAGDVLVVDHLDLDRTAAQAAIAADVAAVVNVSSSVSGRFPTLGAGLLADAGVLHLDRVAPRALELVADGDQVRLHDGDLVVGEERLGGRELDAGTVVELQAEARSSMSAHLDSLTLNSGEFLKREHRMLLHGSGLPDPRTPIAGRPLVVVGAGHERGTELRAVRPFLREQRPVVVGVEDGALAASDAGAPPEVVVLGHSDEDRGLPPAAVLRRARDVVVCEPRGGAGDVGERLTRLGITPLVVRTAAAPEDVALLLAHHHRAAAIVGVGMHATLEELLDSDRAGLAASYLTRLEVGPRLVDAAALPGLYAGRVGLRHVVAVLVIGLLALLAAILVTPVGQEWAATAVDALRTWLGGLR